LLIFVILGKSGTLKGDGVYLPILPYKVLEEESCGLTDWERYLLVCNEIEYVGEEVWLR